MRYFLTFLLFSLYLFGFDYHLKPYVISEGVNCFFGLPANISENNGGNMINSCYVETDEGYIVIDSGPTYSYAQATNAIMEKKKKLKVQYVINTSSDEVHILGNDFFKEQGAMLLGPKNYEKHLINNDHIVANKISKDAFLNTRLVPLDNYLENDLSILLGTLKVDIRLIKNDNEHLIVHIPSKKIVFAGDMIFNNRIVPLKDNRSIEVWQEGLQLLSSLSWRDIISSHGYMTRRSALKNTQSYLSLLKSEVTNSILSGESRDEAVKNIKLLAFSEDELYSFWHPRNVATAYDELSKKIKPYSHVVNVPSKIVKSSVIKKEVKPKRVKKIAKKKIKKKRIKDKRDKKKKVKAVKYISFLDAKRVAKKEHKIIFLKVRSTTCKYCDKLDHVIKTDNRVKKILNNYFKVVSINNDYEKVPYNINIQSTPSLIFIKPNGKTVLMNLSGINALGEFYGVLKEVVDDGHAGGYLKP